jgi:hypothetical protein
MLHIYKLAQKLKIKKRKKEKIKPNLKALLFLFFLLLLTPNNGTGERLTSGPSLVIKAIRLGKVSSKESVKDACGRQCAIVRQRGCLRF